MNTAIIIIKAINVARAAFFDMFKLSVSSFLEYFFENLSNSIPPTIVRTIVDVISKNILDSNS